MTWVLRPLFLTTLAFLVYQDALASKPPAPPLVYSVSGEHGKDPVDGRDGARGSGAGQDGANGTDAKPPTDGRPAGAIHFNLSKLSSGQIRLSGSIKVPTLQVEKSGYVEHQEFEDREIDHTIDLGLGNKLELHARGGDAKRGGNGGDGGDGARGRNGSDATRWSNGEDGGRGGDGGNGGNGTSSSKSGSGGIITVTVHPNETDLLLLLGTVDTSAGAQAPAGTHGQSGNGGSGGRGGSSYSWTYQTCSGSGNNRHCTTHRRSNPGGSNGPSGRSGHTPSAPLTQGARGQDGRFEIRVADGSSMESYSSRYRLRITRFTLESEDGDGIIEPGELVTLSNITVRNDSAMPLPKLPVDFRLTGTGLHHVSETLQMKGSLGGHQSQVLEGALIFRTVDSKPFGVGTRTEREELVSPIGRQQGVDRDHEESPLFTKFAVTYPIEISPIQVPRNLAPGQTAKILWKVRNISERSFGANSDLKRLIATTMGVDAESIRADRLIYRDEHGNEINLNKGFMKALDFLGPGEERVMEGFVTVHPEAELYGKVTATAGLDIGERTAPTQPRQIQSNSITINVSQVFRKTKGSDVLLVTNSSTKTEEVIAWTQAFATLGIQADVWDLNYEGFLDLARPIGTHNEATLSTLYKDGLIIVLDYNLPEQDADQPIRPSQLLKRRQILEALRASNVNFLFVSDSQIIDSQLASELAANLEVQQQPAVLNASGVPKANSTESLVAYFAETPRDQWKGTSFELIEESWFAPDEQTLINRSEKLARRLQATFPTENFLVAYDFDGSKVEDPRDWFRKHYRVGHIAVYPGMSRTKGGIYTTPPSRSDIQEPDFILSRGNLRLIMQALPMREKARNWISALKSNNSKTAIIAADAIFFEIWDEQKAILDRWGSDVEAETQFKGLNQLIEQLKSADLRLKSPQQDPRGMGNHFLDLMARLSFGADLMQEQNGKIFGYFDGNLNDTIQTQIQLSISSVFGERLPSDNRFMAFFGATKSRKEDIEEQRMALEAFKKKRELLIENSEVDALSMYIGRGNLRELYSHAPGAFEATQVVRLSELRSALATEAADTLVRQRFESDRAKEREALMPE